MSAIHDNKAASRFELQSDWGLAKLDYHDTLDALSLDHTEIPDRAQGKGLASKFVLSVLDEIHRRDRKVIPRCEFVQATIKKYPEYATLILV